MNKIEMLRKNLSLLKKLISKEEDPEQAKIYSEQYDETLLEIAREEAKAESAEKISDLEGEVATLRSEQAKVFDGSNGLEGDHIKVGAGKVELYTPPGATRGYNLNREVKRAGALARTKKSRDIINKRFKEDPDVAMGVAKLMVDLYERAKGRSPLEVAEMQAKAANQEGTDSEGGYLTPTEQRFELVGYARESSVALAGARHFSMSSDVQTVPAENAKVSVGVTAEENEATATNPTFAEVTLTAKRYDGYGITSNELLEDAAINGGLVGVILDQFMEATGKAIDSVAFTGVGDPASGLFTAAAGYSEVFDSGSTAFSEILEANLRAAIRKVTKEDRDGAIWLWHDELTWDYIYGMKTTTGEYIWAESKGGGPGPRQIWGYPIESSSQLNAVSDSAAGATFGVFGNLDGLFIGDRITNFDIMLDPYTLMTKHQTRFYSYTRWAVAIGLANKFCRIVTAAS